MVTEKVSIAIRGGRGMMKNKNKKGVGAIKRFLVTIGVWQLKGFWSP